MKVRHMYTRGRTFALGNGRLISFWLDNWLEGEPLCKTYPILYELAEEKKCSVYDVANAGWVVHFRLRLPLLIRDQWYHLARRMNNVSLSDNQDKVIWNWSHNKQYSVKSVYQHLTRDDDGLAYTKIWKAKIPLKIKIMWLVAQKAILTKNNMVIRNWKGDPGCYFYGDLETVDHLLFSCPVTKVVWGVIAICFGQRIRPNSYEFWPWIQKALGGGEKVYMLGLSTICWAVWTARSKTCFEKIRIKAPNEIALSACFFMEYRAGLYPDDVQEIIKKGAQSMIQAAIKLLGHPGGSQRPILILTAGDGGEEDEQKDPDDQDEPVVLQEPDIEG
jgi:hypothetical protein